ncbi:hypothetical protein [Fusibacter ferrireducens]|uniref:ABC transporter permease n=1 Tax=Fusibacter ferrireducens TaxID=2785058 RepID=A0ABR9ZT10_9FIRM|nr:hypothetical protein [Fusibacter ferrireducens]MBF4693609.1 hypothetical protein [Fusibacter ferrireducens]
MLKLLKFEFLRKKTVFLVACIMILLGEAFAVFRYFQIDESVRYFENGNIFALFGGFLAFLFMILYLIDIITLLRQDMFKQEGYMLFMTPFNGYQILGAKVLFALLEGFFIGLIYLLFIFGNAKIMNLTDFEFIFDLGGLDANEIWIIIKILVLGIFSVIDFALTIFLSFALFKSIFTDVRFKGPITFGIFIVINYFKIKISDLVSSLTGNGSAMFYATTNDIVFNSNLHLSLNIGIVYSLVMSALLFAVTGYLLENRINL